MKVQSGFLQRTGTASMSRRKSTDQKAGASAAKLPAASSLMVLVSLLSKDSLASPRLHLDCGRLLPLWNPEPAVNYSFSM
jgi:hypothetical protein